MYDLSRSRTQHLLATTSGAEIVVIGDVMLDRYFWGAVSRVSPEAPVPVVDVDHESFHLGGAANVAGNLLSLGCHPLLCGVIGDDSSGRQLRAIACAAGLDDAGLLVDATRPTTVKTRVIGNNQQIVRLDREERGDVPSSVVDALLDVLEGRPSLRGIIMEDYNKGLLTEELIHRVMDHANGRGIPVFVDPKHRNFFAYRGTFLMKPNRKEAEEAFGRSIRTEADVQEAGRTLLERLDAENVLITLGAAGMMLFEREGTVGSVPTVAKRVADVSGAGDTVIATLAAMMAGGATIREAATLANVAAGVVVAEPGIVAITPESLLQAIDGDNASTLQAESTEYDR